MLCVDDKLIASSLASLRLFVTCKFYQLATVWLNKLNTNRTEPNCCVQNIVAAVRDYMLGKLSVYCPFDLENVGIESISFFQSTF